MSSIADRLERIHNRLGELNRDTNTSVVDLTPDTLQNAINNANVIRKDALEIETELRAIHLKLYGRDWSPDAPYQAEDRVHRVGQPVIHNIELPADIDEALRSKATDLFMAELADDEGE